MKDVELKPCPFLRRRDYKTVGGQAAMIDYDEKHDVLYVVIGDKANSYGDDSQDDIVIMRDFDTDELTGFTILSIAKKIGLQPVVHGQWISKNPHGYEWTFICSNCGYVDGFPFEDRYNYCPNCGAKMDETVEEDK